ncbi:hypothetical protein OB13_01675 [Pontibacter sp. HJ8]
MTRYLLFFLTGFAHALLILLYSDLSAEYASFYRALGLAGAVALFAVASWLTLFSMRAGALVSLVSLLALLYWNGYVAQHILQQETAFDTVILAIHLVLGALALIALVTSLRYTFRRSLSWRAGTRGAGYVVKIILAAIPVSIAVAYLLYA